MHMTGSLTPHDRFLACMRCRPMDRPPLMELPPWEATVARWIRESRLPRAEVLAWQQECDAEENPGVSFAMIPPFPERIVAGDGESFTKTDSMGLTYRQFRDDPQRSMPEYLGFPVRSPADWRAIKRRFDPSSPRYPADWDERRARWRTEHPILRLYGWVATYFGGPSLYGFCRMLMGEEALAYAFYDEPAMVHDMMETMTEFSIAVLARALREAPITLVQFWEDMCYRGGPLISPRMFREYLLPRYRRICDAVRSTGVDVIFLDSDGNVAELAPLWLEAGINGLFPMERAAGNDVAEYRRRFGRRLLMSGGIDKRALARGASAIDDELERAVPIAREGGYVPTVDHGIPPDVSWEAFSHYWRRKKELLGIGEVERSTRHFFW